MNAVGSPTQQPEVSVVSADGYVGVLPDYEGVYGWVPTTGYHALGFWIKADAPTSDPIHLQLRDAPRYTYSTDTPRVAVGPVAREFRHVVVPLAPLLARSPTFIKLLLGWTFFSGRTTAPRTYWIDDIRLFLTRDDLEAYRKRVTP